MFHFFKKIIKISHFFFLLLNFRSYKFSNGYLSNINNTELVEFDNQIKLQIDNQQNCTFCQQTSTISAYIKLLVHCCHFSDTYNWTKKEKKKTLSKGSFWILILRIFLSMLFLFSNFFVSSVLFLIKPKKKNFSFLPIIITVLKKKEE